MTDANGGLDLDLRDRRVIVTGAASNIGRAIALAFAAAGSRVAVVDRDAENAGLVVQEALARGATDAVAEVGDLVDPNAVTRITDAVLDRWGGVDVLVNNAGFARSEFFSNLNCDDIRALVEANLYPALFMTHSVLPAMRATGGSILFISSDAAFGEARNVVYGAAKAGLIAVTRGLAREHGRDAIRINALAPGIVPPADAPATGANSFWRDAAGRSTFSDDLIERITKSIPLRRVTTAEDVAHSVLFLASDTVARQITGQVFSVNGGYSMY